MLAHSLAVDYNIFVICVPVAQLDRALASGAKGRGFESRQAYHFFLQLESLSKTGVVLLIVGCGLLCVKTTFWHLYAIIISTQRFSLVRNLASPHFSETGQNKYHINHSIKRVF